MTTPEQTILAINGGSSSIKFALFVATSTLHLTCKGQIERIGTTNCLFSVQGSDLGEHFTKPIVAKNHTDAMTVLLNWIEENEDQYDLIAVGHRIVHGGSNLYEPQRLTIELVDELRRLIPLDPLHLPDEILIMEAMQRRFPDLLQVVCFDTAFHHDLPRVAQLLPIPRRYEAQGVRRYGFHGLSYEFLMGELSRTEQPAVARGRIILAHLGNGASLAAVRDGQPIDTSMGFTAASGVPMGTRSGDIDPGLAWYLARTEGLTAKQFDDLVNFKSGLLGVSETSSDMRDLLLREREDSRAADAVALFCYQIKKCIGAFAAALGGLDALVFAGGIGENIPAIRARICAELGFLGIELDNPRNERSDDVISADTARVRVRVMRTNEELVIALSVFKMLELKTMQSITNPRLEH
jgi:acetate kinase